MARDALGAARARRGAVRAAAARSRTSAAIEVLALPAGFSYVTFSHTGSTMSDGNPTPLALDGMGAFAGGAGTAPRAGRGHGHDGSCGSSATARTATRPARPAACSATARRPTTRRRCGGTTTLVYDERRRELVQDFVSLNGTTVNCAGGIALPPPLLAHRRGDRRRARTRRTATARFAKRHGYLFQTPVDRGPDELEVGEPIVAAGRFSHEAAAVDQRTGIVYETEDPGSGVGAGFYRYTPDDPERPDRGRRAARCSPSTGQPQVDLREGQRRGAALAGRVGARSRSPTPS